MSHRAARAPQRGRKIRPHGDSDSQQYQYRPDHVRDALATWHELLRGHDRGDEQDPGKTHRTGHDQNDHERPAAAQTVPGVRPAHLQTSAPARAPVTEEET